MRIPSDNELAAAIGIPVPPPAYAITLQDDKGNTMKTTMIGFGIEEDAARAAVVAKFPQYRLVSIEGAGGAA